MASKWSDYANFPQMTTALQKCNKQILPDGTHDMSENLNISQQLQNNFISVSVNSTKNYMVQHIF
jgi:hypothetical protein